MDTSRRAVESYWRSKMIDVATSDEDKVTPVYKLEEICELLRSSHVSIVKEISEFIFKRLQHKSPIVKQKALRVIKYAVGKSGGDFKREMQRNSVAVRQLIHHKGQPDPLKGDALNKSVRETAQEALSAIFAGEDSTKPPPKEGLTQRIEGFGNTNFDMPPDDNKSFLSGVVGIGSATIKQGLNSLTQGQTQSKNKTGTYRSPNLRRSLTNETSYSGSNERHNETMPSSRVSTDISGHWGQELKITQTDNTGGSSGSNSSREKSREERLLETIVTPGGIRLQPTRDALQAFLAEASKLNALALSKALEAKLQSHMWQVCVKGLCVLEAILRKKDDEHFSIVASYFTENIDAVVQCSESPQASVREKANKVLSILNGEQSGSRMSQPDRNLKTEKTVVQMPDLIDTNDPNGNEHSFSMKDESSASLIDGFLGDGLGTDVHNNQPGNNDDPFADVSFHGQSNKEEHESADIFSGMATVDKPGAVFTQTMASGSGPELFDIFGSDSGIPQGSQGNAKDDLNDLMAGLSVNGNESSSLQNGTSLGGPTETLFSDSTANPNPQMSDVLSNILQFQAPGITPNPIFPIDPKLYNGQSSGLMFNPMAFGSQPINYGAMSNLLAQQQFLSTMTNLQQQTGNLQSQNIGPTSNPSGTQVGGYTSALPDIFNPIIASQAPTSTMNASKKDDTRAFDFISGRSAKKRPLYPWVGGRDKVCIHLTPGSSCCIS
ncbi:VHS domain-containing protein At3g16270-like isoform X1 [Cynara cardunculus var. scolymus]|uniref:VHS domain-containing protein At3g16270-like isoform X1 n=1 Tax=Cynara cardunculus var. scolymus TaxID=59895 RepID=UPI000D62A55F|nr:VHS domain-containing protein At3g16270-like isoform X1 [Cynara cardunculus var. scolymus]